MSESWAVAMPPADDHPRADVQDECDANPSSAGGHIGEAGAPQPVGRFGVEAAPHQSTGRPPQSPRPSGGRSTGRPVAGPGDRGARAGPAVHRRAQPPARRTAAPAQRATTMASRFSRAQIVGAPWTPWTPAAGRQRLLVVCSRCSCPARPGRTLRRCRGAGAWPSSTQYRTGR